MPKIKFVDTDARLAYESAQTPPEPVMLAFEGILRHAPEANRYVIAALAAAKHGGTLSQRLVELVRLRIAFWTQCRTCMTMRFEECLEDGLDQDAVCALQAPETAEHLSAAERAAIRYVDIFANNWLSMDDKFFDSMREVFTEAEIVQLGFVCALSLGMGRLMASYAITDDLPEAMQGAPGEGRYKPWEVAIDALVFPALPDGAAQTHLLDQARSHAPTISA